MDQFDRKLLDIVQRDASLPLRDLGDRIGLSPSAVQRRLERLRKNGWITRQCMVLNPDKLPNTVTACVLASLDRESRSLHQDFRTRILKSREVQQCYDLSGEWDYLIIIVADGMANCRDVIEHLLLDAPNLKSYQTYFVFESVKRELGIPMSLTVETSD